MIEGQEGVTWEDWLALADAADRAGLEGLFRSDHYLSILRGGRAGSLDAWVTLAALAARTERIRLGTLVSPVTFRHASVIAKCAATAQEISEGRVELGLGAGWFEREHGVYGFPFPPVRERMDELEAQLAEVRRQWGDAEDVWPKPSPAPNLIVGGSAKPRTVRAAVRFADEYNTTFATLDQARERRQTVDDAARAAGREPLTFSVMTGCVVGRDDADVRRRIDKWRHVTGRDTPPPIAGTVEEVVQTLREYEAAGVERMMLQHLVHEDREMVEVLGEVAAACASPPAGAAEVEP
jgi:alkanesulfonate monooxygenase SsuD/methylene tetrahydromethanopterin reductase-like flavin-dependent oxidoreductase (luciferase family)